MSYNELATYFVNSSMAFQHIYFYNVQEKEQLSMCESPCFVVVLSGKMTMLVEDTSYMFEPGTLLHVPSGVKLLKKSTGKKTSASSLCTLPNT